MRIIITAGWSIYLFGYLSSDVSGDVLNLVYNHADFINKIALGLRALCQCFEFRMRHALLRERPECSRRPRGCTCLSDPLLGVLGTCRCAVLLRGWLMARTLQTR